MSQKRYYMQDSSGRTVKFLHFDQINTINQHIYIPAQSSGLARVVSKYPARIVAPTGISDLQYDWNRFEQVEGSPELRQISFHPQNLCFRLQLQQGGALDVRTDDILANFIDFIFLSDVIGGYRRTSNIRNPGVDESAVVNSNQFVRMHGSYAIGSYDLRRHPVLGSEATAQGQGSSNRVQTVAYGVLQEASSDVLSTRPRGAIFNTLFYLRDGNRLVESYIIA